MKKYSKIKNFILHIKEDFLLDVALKDFCGFVSKDFELDNILRPYLAHTNPYCLFVKETEKGYMKCLAQKKPMYNKCLQGKPFIGYCHAGVGELVVPILKNGLAIGSINVSHFSHDPARAHKLSRDAFALDSEKRQQKAAYLYDTFIKNSPMDISGLLFSLELLAEFLSEIAKVDITEDTKIAYSDNNGENHKILKDVDNFLSQNYGRKFSAKDLSLAIDISEKALSKVIAKEKNLSFSTYVNTFRIGVSKKLLIESSLSLDEIAKSVGFSSLAYFNKIFTSIMQITPSKFIEYYKNENLVLK